MQLRIHIYEIRRIRVRSASQVEKRLTNILIVVKFCKLSPRIPFCFCYRMRRLRQQIATVCGAYGSKLLPQAPHTIENCYHMRRIRLQFATACGAYACKQLIFTRFCYRMHRLRQQFATVCGTYTSKLLPHAPPTLANCYCMRRIRQQSSSQANFVILAKSSFNQ